MSHALDDAHACATLADLKAGRMPAAGFGHRAHVLVAWHLVRTRPFEQACVEISEALRTVTQALGVGEKYDAELTRVWMNKVASCADTETDFGAWLARNPQLVEGS